MLNIIMAGAGITIFIYSMTLFWRTYRLLEGKKISLLWIALAFLVIFFLLGYVAFEYLMINGKEILSFKALVSQIFFWGAVFVLICAKLFHSTFIARKRVEETLLISNKHLQQEITERKRAEYELAQLKEKQYRTLIENLPQKVFLKDINSVYISCNENYASNLKIEPKEIVGKTDYDFYPKELADKYRADDLRIITSGKTEEVEERYSQNGKEIFVHTLKTCLKDDEDRAVGLFGLSWDITERKHAEDALEESLMVIGRAKREWESTVDSIPQLICLIDSQGCILRTNRVVEQWNLGQVVNVKGKKLHELLHPGCADSACYLETFWPIAWEKLSNGIPTEYEAYDKILNLHIHIQVQPILPGICRKGEETASYAVVVLLDVTERRIAEEERRRASELKTASEIKSKFTSMVSHELRSPLGVIKEGINLVLEGLAGNINDMQKDLLDTAKRNTDRLSRLINDALDFDKIKSGKMEFDIRGNDINEVALEVRKAMSLLAEEKGLDLVVDVDDSIPKIRFDKDKIVQVFTNLVDNAIKFTEKGSISISMKQEDNVVHVIVQDTGVGIEAKDMQKLFHAFEQLDNIRDKKKGGTGLGLAISKEIILAHKGKIWAESEAGRGATFHFTLPIKERRG
jgi:two-component system sensor histidine kinase/response regulator